MKSGSSADRDVSESWMGQIERMDCPGGPVMTSLEWIIVGISLAASCGGALVLLASLSGKRSQLVQAFRIDQEKKQLEMQIQLQRELQQRKNAKSEERILEVSSEIPQPAYSPYPGHCP